MFERVALAALCLGCTVIGGFSAVDAQSGATPIGTSSITPATATPAEQLHEAVRSGKLDEVARLITQGVDVNALDRLGSTPLLDAAWTGNAEICQFLIQHGADVNARHREAGSTALQYAVLTGKAAVVRLLLAAGARVDVPYRDHQTVLHVAASRGNPQIVDLLLAAHADSKALDANDDTPLD